MPSWLNLRGDDLHDQLPSEVELGGDRTLDVGAVVVNGGGHRPHALLLRPAGTGLNVPPERALRPCASPSRVRSPELGVDHDALLEPRPEPGQEVNVRGVLCIRPEPCQIGVRCL